VSQADAAMSSAVAPSQRLYFTERGAGTPLLLVHGLMVTGDMFAPVADRFAASHRVIIPDLRGHGRSRALLPPYTAQRLAADLAGLLQRLDIASASVLGYSQGGAIAQQLALDWPKQCSRLVLACTYAFNMATPREQLEGRVTPFLMRVLGPRRFAQFVVSQGARELDKAGAEWLMGLMANQDRKLMIAAWKETMAFDSRRRLTEIACPTLVVAGSNDQAVPMHHARMLHDSIRGSKVVVIPGAGHTLIWTHPDELVRVTEEFLLSSGASHEDSGAAR
jgi:pimeloyl-ACP methyl ester carboxylesterase